MDADGGDGVSHRGVGAILLVSEGGERGRDGEGNDTGE